MTDVRKNLAAHLEPLRKTGLSLRELSRRLGRNESYLQQYLAGKKSPRKLAHEDKLALHALVGIPLEQLGLSASAAMPAPAKGDLSAADDVEPYQPGSRGDVVSDSHVLQELRTEQIVLVETAPSESLAPRLLLREFVRPALAVTNRAGENEAFNLDGDGGDRARVVGVVRSMLRPM